MPLEDVAVFNEDGMQGTYAMFLVLRCRIRWTNENELFPPLSPAFRWAIEILFFNEEINKLVDYCTFEQTEKNGQKHLVCCRGKTMPCALQEYKHLGMVPCTPKDLFQFARQFEASGIMNVHDGRDLSPRMWYRTFVKYFHEDLNREHIWCEPFHNIRKRERTAYDYVKSLFIPGCFALLPFLLGFLFKHLH